MTTTDPERDENDLLLPWRATGRLDRAQAERLDAALASDPELARRLDIAKAEQRETVAVNEGLGVPSPRARDDLFARIDADLAGRRTTGGWLQRIGAMLAGLSPPVLAGSALAACALILLQAGLLTGTWLGAPTASYETASHGGSGPAADGTFILVSFAPSATAAQITEALGEARMSIADGPRAGGIYRVRLAEGSGSLGASLDRLRAKPGLVLLAVPETAPAR
jgi:anti-sigma factor RsiW